MQVPVLVRAPNTPLGRLCKVDGFGPMILIGMIVVPPILAVAFIRNNLGMSERLDTISFSVLVLVWSHWLLKRGYGLWWASGDGAAGPSLAMVLAVMGLVGAIFPPRVADRGQTEAITDTMLIPNIDLVTLLAIVFVIGSWWWALFVRMGHTYPMLRGFISVFLLFVPGVNFLGALWIVGHRWPVVREAEHWRQQCDKLQGANARLIHIARTTDYWERRSIALQAQCERLQEDNKRLRGLLVEAGRR